jgi:hypothetical protein
MFPRRLEGFVGTSNAKNMTGKVRIRRGALLRKSTIAALKKSSVNGDTAFGAE